MKEFVFHRPPPKQNQSCLEASSFGHSQYLSAYWITSDPWNNTWEKGNSLTPFIVKLVNVSKFDFKFDFFKQKQL